MFLRQNVAHVVVHHKSKPTDWVFAAAIVGASAGVVYTAQKIKNRLDVILKKVASPSEIAKVAVADKANVLRPKNILARFKGLINKKED